MIVLLDDERSFKPHVVPADDDLKVFRTAESMIEWIEVEISSRADEGKPLEIDQVWFDHDLGLTRGTDGHLRPSTSVGVAQILADMMLKKSDSGEPRVVVDHVIVHTSNVSGGYDLMRVFQSTQMRDVVKNLSRVSAGDYLFQDVRLV